jgi:hypothetical protein
MMMMMIAGLFLVGDAPPRVVGIPLHRAHCLFEYIAPIESMYDTVIETELRLLGVSPDGLRFAIPWSHDDDDDDDDGYY